MTPLMKNRYALLKASSKFGSCLIHATYMLLFQTTAQRLQASKTISDVSQSEFNPQDASESEDSDDSYSSSSTGSSSSGSSSDSNTDEVKVVVG